jgi:hypothetical protein
MIIIANLMEWRWPSVSVVVLWTAGRRLFHLTIDVVLISVLVLPRIRIERGVSGCVRSSRSMLVRKRNTSCSSRLASGLRCRRWCRRR